MKILNERNSNVRVNVVRDDGMICRVNVGAHSTAEDPRWVDVSGTLPALVRVAGKKMLPPREDEAITKQDLANLRTLHGPDAVEDLQKAVEAAREGVAEGEHGEDTFVETETSSEPEETYPEPTEPEEPTESPSEEPEPQEESVTEPETQPEKTDPEPPDVNAMDRPELIGYARELGLPKLGNRKNKDIVKAIKRELKKLGYVV